MRVQTARVNQLLLGKDRTTALGGVALAAGLFLVVFVAAAVWTQFVFSLEYAAIVVLVLLTGLFTYYNEGVLVSVLIATAPVYAYFIEVIHVGNIGPTPYLRKIRGESLAL